MFRELILSVLMPIATATAENPLHVFYYNGEAIEQMTSNGVTVSIGWKDTGRLNQVAIYVNNGSSDAVNVIASDFSLHESSPKTQDLKLKSQQDVQKLGGRNAFGQLATKMGTGLVSAKDKIAGKEVTPASTAAPDFETQVRWLARANKLAERGQMASLSRMYLRDSTVFPGSTLAGVLWFDRDDASNSTQVRVRFNERDYQFSFPPPAYATTPANPNRPDGVGNAEEHSTTSQRDSAPSSVKAGVLGISGENWNHDGVIGVRVMEVEQNGAADVAGLRPANIITEVDGRKITSTQELAAALEQRSPGSRIQVIYLYWTNLGWMPKEIEVILSAPN